MDTRRLGPSWGATSGAGSSGHMPKHRQPGGGDALQGARARRACRGHPGRSPWWRVQSSRGDVLQAVGHFETAGTCRIPSAANACRAGIPPSGNAQARPEGHRCDVAALERVAGRHLPAVVEQLNDQAAPGRHIGARRAVFARSLRAGELAQQAGERAAAGARAAGLRTSRPAPLQRRRRPDARPLRIRCQAAARRQVAPLPLVAADAAQRFQLGRQIEPAQERRNCVS